MINEEFAQLFLNDETQYVECLRLDYHPTYKSLREIYSYKNMYFQIDYILYPNEDVFNIVMDREFTVQQVIGVEVSKKIIEWQAI